MQFPPIFTVKLAVVTPDDELDDEDDGFELDELEILELELDEAGFELLDELAGAGLTVTVASAV